MDDDWNFQVCSSFLTPRATKNRLNITRIPSSSHSIMNHLARAESMEMSSHKFALTTVWQASQAVSNAVCF